MNRTMGILTWCLLIPVVVIVIVYVGTGLISRWEAQQPGYVAPGNAIVFWLGAHVIGVPTWIVLVILSVLGILPGTRFAVPRYWECASCGYNMRTVPGPTCPECGTPHAIPEQKDR